MCGAILRKVELLNFVIAYRNLYDKFSTDFQMSFHKKNIIMPFHSKQFLLVCTVSVYNFHVSVAVDFNFISISPLKTRFISI